ncbi:MAG: class I SAM-dependent methyltransferase [Roseburia sp.]|nr:class I SAM-dependent methyltransferase [Roseburia sp.]
MEAYTSFAQVYDLFMDNVPYEEWSEYIIALLKEEKIENGLVLDLGCGTGKMTRLLAKAGFDMIGIDYSEDMLEIAREYQYHNQAVETEQVHVGEELEPLSEAVLRSDEDAVKIEEMAQEENASNILYLLQDMREFELYGTVRAIISICDSMNYILEEEDLLQVFRLVNNYLDPNGVFIFDMNTRYKYASMLGETTITENREEGSFIWENYFDEEEDINQYDLTLFIREEGDLYRKYEETHYQRVYDLDTVKCLLKEAGMEFVAAYDAFTKEPVREDSERIYIIAREHGK